MNGTSRKLKPSELLKANTTANPISDKYIQEKKVKRIIKKVVKMDLYVIIFKHMSGFSGRSTPLSQHVLLRAHLTGGQLRDSALHRN